MTRFRQFISAVAIGVSTFTATYAVVIDVAPAPAAISHETLLGLSAELHAEGRSASNVNTGHYCISSACNYRYYTYIPKAGSKTCAIYQGQINCVTWMAIPCRAPASITCPPYQVGPSPAQLQLANGRKVFELTWSSPSYYTVTKGSPYNTMRKVENRFNNGIGACTYWVYYQSHLDVRLSVGTKVFFC